MKNKSYIGISLMILLFGIYALPKIVNSFENNNVVKKSKRLDKISSSTERATLLKFEKVPNFNFTNQNGNKINNQVFNDKVYVVEFFFTNCTTICPILNTNLVKIQDVYKDNNNFGIASFSIDPERDSPKVLKKYAELNGATMKNWHFLNGKKETIYTLANQGFKIFAGENKEEADGFEHSGLIALIDKNGYIRSRSVTQNGFKNPLKFYDGLSIEQVNWLREDIALLLQE
jgi:protein SCO1/2